VEAFGFSPAEAVVLMEGEAGEADEGGGIGFWDYGDFNRRQRR
jgi:hypothetical protein